MKGLIRGVVVVLTCSWTLAGLAAETESYAGIDVGRMTISFPLSLTTPAVDHSELVVRGRIGAFLSPEEFPGLAVEAHLGMGIGGEKVPYRLVNLTNGETVVVDPELEIETLIGIYLRADLLKTDSTSFYGLLGFASAQSQARRVTVNVAGPTEPPKLVLFGNTETETGLSFALGINYSFTDDISLQAEYISVVRGDAKDGFDVSGLSFGVNFAMP